MPSSYTNLLGFVLPVTGELSGTWGTTVNAQLTQLIEDSIANYATASVAGGNWTLSTTSSGASNEARMQILVPTGAPGVSRDIYAPKLSKSYIVINRSDSTVVLRGGPGTPTTGMSIPPGVAQACVWDPSAADFRSIGTPLTSRTGSTLLAAGTTAQRDTVPQSGMFRFNTTLGRFEGYANGAWGAVGGGATGGGTNAVFVENQTYVTTNYTLGLGGQTDCTVSIASPGVVTQANTFVGGEAVFLTTTGALPTGLSAETAYYVATAGLSSASYQLSLTRGGASINTSGSQSGTHKCGTIYNASTVGPLAIASGVSVRVPTGARLVVQ